MNFKRKKDVENMKISRVEMDDINHPNETEVSYFIGNDQVEYYMIYRKVNLNASDSLDNFKPYKAIIGTYSLFFNKVKDITTGESYNFCIIDRSDNFKSIHYNFFPNREICNEFVAISFREYYYEVELPKFKNVSFTSKKQKLFHMDDYIYSQMQETLDSEKNKQRKRTTI